MCEPPALTCTVVAGGPPVVPALSLASVAPVDVPAVLVVGAPDVEPVVADEAPVVGAPVEVPVVRPSVSLCPELVLPLADVGSTSPSTGHAVSNHTAPTTESLIVQPMSHVLREDYPTSCRPCRPLPATPSSGGRPQSPHPGDAVVVQSPLMSSLLDVVAERFLTHSRPGRLLAAIARTAIPIVTADRFAARSPEPALESSSPSPLVEEIEPRACPAGALDGDVVIKDQIDVAGLRTGLGLADGGELATRDAAIVARIVAAGGRIVGKTKMTELGIDGIGTLMNYPMPRNPRAPHYSPGGSSTGTAVAVAAGLARYGVGGDGLGSVRIPAAFCGLVGLKPGRDRLPQDGIRSAVRTLDAIGPITRTVDDCARLWQVMAGEPLSTLTPWVPVRVGLPVFAEPVRVARSIRKAFYRVLATLGVDVERVALPGLEHVTFLGGLIGTHELATGPVGDRVQTATGRMSLALGRSFSARDAARLQQQRDALRAATERALEHTPILAMPTTAIPPPALSRELLAGHPSVLMLRALGAFTPLANLADVPAIAVPCGVDDRGRPLSIMFVTERGGETALLRLALAVERTGLATRAIGA